MRVRRSLQLQLAARLGALFLTATALAIAALLYETDTTASFLSEQTLIERANELASAVGDGAGDDPVVTLPLGLAALYESPSERSMFAIRDADGDVIAASSAAIRTLVSSRPPANDEPSFFPIESFGPAARDYNGLDIRVATVAGPLSITVAQASRSGALVHAMLREFTFDVAWVIPVFVAATLLVGVLAIRRGLAPLREASAQAAAIEPSAMAARLSTEELPTEVVPLVEAMNRALDRLEQGFVLQRRFTANAAHELRTPLAIITGALEAMEGNGELGRLRQDVSRMNRLVDQLLRVARLDGVVLDVSAEVDLGRLAADVVEYMAPLAIEQDRSVALVGADRSVRVRGNRHAIEDALRNLIENAIAHAPPHTEVIVELGEDRRISVSDRGTGVRPEDRAYLFDRFWRGKDPRDAGAGLGLAIVKETMKAHGGRVEVSDSPGGGARFTLYF